MNEDTAWYKHRVVDKSISSGSSILTFLGLNSLYNKLINLKGAVAVASDGTVYGNPATEVNFWEGTTEPRQFFEEPQIWTGIAERIATEVIYMDPLVADGLMIGTAIGVGGIVYGLFTLGRKAYNKVTGKTKEIEPDISDILDKIEPVDISDIIDVPASELEMEVDA